MNDIGMPSELGTDGGAVLRDATIVPQGPAFHAPWLAAVRLNNRSAHDPL